MLIYLKFVNMKAPEKIYVHVKGDKVTNTWNSTWIGVHDVEYIRKDAFIKKAEKWLKEHVLEYAPELNFGVWKTDPNYYTKHFIKDFKKYMEE